MNDPLVSFLDSKIKYSLWCWENTCDAIIANQIQDEKINGWMSHSINAFKIWMSRIQGDPIKLDPFFLHPQITWYPLFKSCVEELQKINSEMDGNKSIEYVFRDGNTYTISIKEIVFLLINHTTHHRGQIASRLRELMIDPPISDYPQYKRLGF